MSRSVRDDTDRLRALELAKAWADGHAAGLEFADSTISHPDPNPYEEDK